MSRKVTKVVVVGRDAAAWLSALALQRAFGRTGVEVRVVELPSLLGPSDVYAAVPSLGALHGLLGLAEHEVLEATSGVPVLGQRFADWSRDLPSYIHGYDTQLVAIDDIEFVHFWVKARAEGLKVALDDFSLAAAAAKHGRSVIERDGRSTEMPVAPGYHLDARTYVALVRQRALRAGTKSVGSGTVVVRREGDRILSVTLDDGQSIEGDLFIDASGVEALLIGGASGAAFQAWRDDFPADRILVASAPALKPLPGFSQITAFAAGWTGLYPLKDRTAVVAVYDSGAMSDQQVLDGLPQITGFPLRGEATVAPLAPGMRPAWVGNCVAIGDAAVVLEPLDAVQLHLIHMGLTQLIALFPVDAEAMPEAEVCNVGFAAHVRNVRDFQISHYRLNRRPGEPFWDRARTTPAPDSLQTRFNMFSARGKVVLFDDESFQDQNWTALFIGHGLIPRSYDPMVDAVPAEQQMGRFRGLLGKIAEEVRAMPQVEAEFGVSAAPAFRP